MKSEDVTKFLQSHDKILTDEELLFMNEQQQSFPKMETIHGEDFVKTVEMRTKNLNNYRNLVEKAETRRLTNFGRNSTLGKRLPSSIECCRENTHERQHQSIWEASLVTLF